MCFCLVQDVRNEVNTLQLLKGIFFLVCLVVAFRVPCGQSIKEERHTVK
jgi:hypothetical protein